MINDLSLDLWLVRTFWLILLNGRNYAVCFIRICWFEW